MSALFAMLASNPAPGKVKPGLAACLGAPSAAKLYRSFIMDLCERFAGLSVPERVLAYAPRGARKAVSLLASRHWRLMLQEGSSTGAALAAIFEHAWQRGCHRDSGDAFDALVERVDAFGLILGLVPHWYEVEDRAGLDRLASHLRALALVGDDELPRRTQTLLQRLRLAKGE